MHEGVARVAVHVCTQKIRLLKYHTMTKTMSYGPQHSGIVDRPQEQDVSMGQDNGSIRTAMSVRATHGACTLPLHNEAVSGSFEIPRGLPDAGRKKDDEDDISVLTEFSGMEEEEDASSQVTAGTETWTVVTTATDSTTIPTRNTRQVLPEQTAKRRHGVCENGNPLLDNSNFKRRRKR
jgi:hypothetical protein